MFCRPFQIVFVGLAEVWTFTDTSSSASSARTLAKNILKNHTPQTKLIRHRPYFEE